MTSSEVADASLASRPSAEAAHLSAVLPHRGRWALMAFVGHAPGLWLVRFALSLVGNRPSPPRFGPRTIRLNLLVLGVTLVATAAAAATGFWWTALALFVVGHFAWSFLLAGRIWAGTVGR